MRREGRQRGWVRVYDLGLVVGPEHDPISAAHTAAVPGGAATVANGGFVRAPRRPTNHSKPSALYKGPSGKGDGASASGKGRRKFWHDELKTYYLDLADDGAAVDDGGYDTDTYASPMHAHCPCPMCSPFVARKKLDEWMDV